MCAPTTARRARAGGGRSVGAASDREPVALFAHACVAEPLVHRVGERIELQVLAGQGQQRMP